MYRYKKRYIRKSRFWLAFLGTLSMGTLFFSMCDDDPCPDCDIDNDGDCDCDEDGDGKCDREGYKHNSGFFRACDEEWEKELREGLEYARQFEEAQENHSSRGGAGLPNRKKATQEGVIINRQNDKEKELKRKQRKKRIMAFLFKGKRIKVGLDCGGLLEQDAGKVEQLLKEQAFTQITLVPILDVGPTSVVKAGTVKEISIDDQKMFLETDMFPYDAQIVIYVHDKKEITVPFSGKSLRKKNYLEVYDQLQALGFTKIHKYPMRDVIVGWIKKKGTVESVSINGNDRFKENTTYKFDAEITIHYHSPINEKLY